MSSAEVAAPVQTSPVFEPQEFQPPVAQEDGTPQEYASPTVQQPTEEIALAYDQGYAQNQQPQELQDQQGQQYAVPYGETAAQVYSTVTDAAAKMYSNIPQTLEQGQYGPPDQVVITEPEGQKSQYASYVYQGQPKASPEEPHQFPMYQADPQQPAGQPQHPYQYNDMQGQTPQPYGAQPQGQAPQPYGAQPQRQAPQPYGAQPQPYGAEPQPYGAQPQQYGAQSPAQQQYPKPDIPMQYAAQPQQQHPQYKPQAQNQPKCQYAQQEPAGTENEFKNVDMSLDNQNALKWEYRKYMDREMQQQGQRTVDHPPSRRSRGSQVSRITEAQQPPQGQADKSKDYKTPPTAEKPAGSGKTERKKKRGCC